LALVFRHREEEKRKDIRSFLTGVTMASRFGKDPPSFEELYYPEPEIELSEEEIDEEFKARGLKPPKR
jgi:hypothetical protein